MGCDRTREAFSLPDHQLVAWGGEGGRRRRPPPPQQQQPGSGWRGWHGWGRDCAPRPSPQSAHEGPPLARMAPSSACPSRPPCHPGSPPVNLVTAKDSALRRGEKGGLPVWHVGWSAMGQPAGCGPRRRRRPARVGGRWLQRPSEMRAGQGAGRARRAHSRRRGGRGRGGRGCAWCAVGRAPVFAASAAAERGRVGALMPPAPPPPLGPCTHGEAH
jgi:hypothetical protein